MLLIYSVVLIGCYGWAAKLRRQLNPITESFAARTMSFEWPQWHGPHRDNHSPETGLLPQWPQQGPTLLWMQDGLGEGWSSPTLANGRIFVTGTLDDKETLVCFDLEGNPLWKTAYGTPAHLYPGTRSTPAYDQGHVYVISGSGEVVCIDVEREMIAWKINGLPLFQVKIHRFGISEAPLVFDGKVFYTACGPRTTLVAFDQFTGEVLWESPSIDDQCAYVSPQLVHRGQLDIIVTVTGKHIVGIDQSNGELLWVYPYVENHRTKKRDETLIQNAVTPLYHEGRLFVTSGYNHVGVALNLSEDGRQVELAWVNNDLDCHHGGVIYSNGYVYGSSWRSNLQGNWVCLDWKTGQTMYEHLWYGKGSILCADGKLYCYEEREGHLALVNPTPKGFEIISAFPITTGTGEHWAHPLICEGKLYIRHGDSLMAFDVKKR